MNGSTFMQKTRFQPKRTRPQVAPPALPCVIQRECGLCPHVNRVYETGLQEKYQHDVAKLQAIFPSPVRILPPVASPKKLRYRTSMKLAIRTNERGWIEMGVFKPGTHHIVEMQKCPLHAPPLQRLLHLLPFALKKSGIIPWNEKTQQGELKFLAARSAHLTEQLMVTFVVTTESCRDKLLACLEDLLLQGMEVHSAHMNLNNSLGNEIFGPTTTRINGLKRLRETLCNIKLSISPTSFLQINPWTASKLYHRISQLAGTPTPGAVAIDLYSGVGQIAMLLGRNGYRVAAIEETPSAKEDAALNLKSNRLESYVEFFSCSVEEFATTAPDWAQAPQLIVVNPSRKGLSDSAREFIDVTAHKSSALLIYVSCNLTTLLRDLEYLQQKAFRVNQLEAFDLFAQTDKLEWLVVLSTHP